MLNYFLIHLIMFSCFFSTSYSLNLTLTDYHNPVANHILDAEVINNTLIVSAMVQGIEFYDISNPSILNHLTNFSLSEGGGWGGGSKSKCVRARGDYAYFTSNNGIYIVNISNSSNPQNLGAISGTSSLNLENLDLHENLLAVCAHNNGVLLYDISNPINPIYLTTLQVENAWAVAILGSTVYIGSNNQILVMNSNTSILYTSIIMEDAIKDLAIDNDLLYVAHGSGGISVYNISNPFNPQFLDNFNTGTMAHRISTFDNKLAVSDWEDIDILEWDGISLNQVGYKNTGNRTMAIATKDGGFIYSAEWASVQLFKYGEINGPDIDLNSWELNYPFVEIGSSSSLFLEIINNGNQILSNSDNYTTNSEFSVLNPLQDLYPGESQIVEILYTASNANASGSYRIYSNDPDEPEIICETNGNIDGANIGDHAPDFNLSVVANGNGNFQLSNHIDEIIVIAFFAPN